MKLSKNFNAYDKPFFYSQKPQKVITRVKFVASFKKYNGDIIDIGNKRYQIEMEDDGYDRCVVFREQEITEEENANYEKQLKQYNEKKKKYREELKDWQEQKKIYDKQLADEKERYERKLLEQLKEKYDK